MKKIIASLITVALLLSMTACGGVGRPEIVVSKSVPFNEDGEISKVSTGTLSYY